MKNLAEYTKMYALFYKLRDNMYIWMWNCKSQNNITVHNFSGTVCKNCNFDMQWYTDYVKSGRKIISNTKTLWDYVLINVPIQIPAHKQAVLVSNLPETHNTQLIDAVYDKNLFSLFKSIIPVITQTVQLNKQIINDMMFVSKNCTK